MEYPVEPLVDRRGAKRSRTPSEHGVVLARVRPGHAASVVDISAHGALIETAHRLLPGSFVDLHLESSRERAVIRGRVLRCSVASVLATCIWYQGAVHFDRSLSWLTDAKWNEYLVLLPEGVLALQS
jgi:hypothetical protein